MNKMFSEEKKYIGAVLFTCVLVSKQNLLKLKLALKKPSWNRVLKRFSDTFWLLLKTIMKYY